MTWNLPLPPPWWLREFCAFNIYVGMDKKNFDRFKFVKLNNIFFNIHVCMYHITLFRDTSKRKHVIISLSVVLPSLRNFLTLDSNQKPKTIFDFMIKNDLKVVSPLACLVRSPVVYRDPKVAISDVKSNESLSNYFLKTKVTSNCFIAL